MRSQRNVLILTAVCFVFLGSKLTAQTAPALTMTPSSASLSAGQSITFQALASGASPWGLPDVVWSVVPPVGTIEKGYYRAPAVVNGPQIITVVATDVTNSSNMASATVFLLSSVGISVTPSSASLQAGQSTSFSASVSGTLNTSVAWSLSPSVGSINNGVYTAPATVNTAQTILVTATSAADPSKSAQASVTLSPAPAPSNVLTITPAQVTLQPSQMQRFAAMLPGGTASGVEWSISPKIGAIIWGGEYVAPAVISQTQTVTLTATVQTPTFMSASATITLAPPPSVPPSVPPTPPASPAYNGISDTIPRAEGPAPALGPANSIYIDPDFGTHILRVTDQNSIPGKQSIDLFGAGGWESEFSADSSKFVISAADGSFYFYRFDPGAFQASLILDPANSSQPLNLNDFFVSGFSYQNPNIVYGMTSDLTNHTIEQYDFSTNRVTTVANIDNFLPAQDQHWIGGGPLYESVYNDYYDNNFVVPASHYLVVYSKATNQAAVINIADATFKAFNSSTYVPLGGGAFPSASLSMHSVQIDKSGRYVAVSFNDSNANVYVDLQTGTWKNDPYSHRITGFGVVAVNSGNQANNDSDGYYLTDLSNPSQRTWLASNPDLPHRWNTDGHPSWNNARPGLLLPFIVDNQDVFTSIFPQRSWDDELLAVATDGSNKVWRFAHMHSYLTGFYWTTPFSHVSPDGKYALFTSNWGGTLGIASDNQGSFNGNPPDQKRVDLFLVELNQLYPVPSVDSIPPSTPIFVDSSLNGSQGVSGTINATAVATDNVGVVAMRYAVDGNWQPEITAAPFVFSLDTRTLSNGYHAIQAYARDAQNNITTNTISFIVNNTAP